MATVAQLNTYMDAAVAAMDAADWETAERKLMAAKAIVSTMPNATASGFGSTWNANAIDVLLNRVTAMRNAAATSAAGGGLRRTDITYRAEGDDGD